MTAGREAVAPPVWAPADEAALREALAAAGPSRLPEASFGDWLVDAATWLRDVLFDAFESAVPFSGWVAAEQAALYAALAVAGAAAAVVLVLALRARARRKAAAGPLTEELAPPSPQATADADWWAAELGRRLAGADLRGALDALWWWAARRLDPPGLDPAWTTGQLLRASGRPALSEPLRRLERLQWRGVPPRREDVEALHARLRETLA